MSQRYKGIKGKFWTVFSEYVRKRDMKNFGGRCVTCDQAKDYSELQAGHFAPAGNCGFGLLFDEMNVHAECQYDNAFNKGHLIQYKTNLERRYGKPTVEDIERRYNDSRYKGITTKNWTKKEYEEKISQYKAKIRDLDA